MATQNGSRRKMAERQTEDLFIEKSIYEISQIEQKARLDIERKKEELRQLVGERYRDMIESADSVISMKESTVNIVDQLSRVHEKCQTVQQTHFLKGTGGQQAPPTISSTQSIGAQMQVLIELQEKIWSGLEKGEYLNVGSRYLLMQYIISRLRTMSISWPHLLVHLWQQMADIKETIIEKCHSYIQSVLLKEEVTLECLTVIVLLERCDMLQLLKWFLKDRQVTIQRLSDLSSIENKSVKDTVIELFKVLRYTLTLICDLFTPQSTTTSIQGHQSKLLLDINEFIHSKKDCFSKEIVSQHLLKSLPQYITSYRPSLHIPLTDLTPHTVHTNIKPWIEQCLATVLNHLRQSLSHVTSLKGLASVRNYIYTLLATNIHSSSVHISVQWDRICQSVIGEPISLYETFLQPVLIQRAKDIINSLLSEAHTNSINLLQTLIQLFTECPDSFIPDVNFPSYLWSSTGNGSRGEGSTDSGTVLPAATATNTTEDMLLSLKMKSNGCTPRIYNFCQEYSNNLNTLIDGLQVFSLSPSPSDALSGIKDSEDFPFNWKNDVHTVSEHLQNLLISYIEKFLVEIDVIVNRLSKEDSFAMEGCSQTMDKILLLARLCKCMTLFTPSLKVLIEGSYDLPKTTASSNKTSSSHWKKSFTNRNKLSGSPQPKIYSLLEGKVNELHRLWGHSIAVTASRQIGNSLNSDLDYLSMANLVNWDDITITEESEKGQPISSLIHLPSQASLFLSTTLFSLCQEIIRVGGHHMDRTILREVTMKVFEGILNSYGSLLKAKDGGDGEEDGRVTLCQDSSLQMLYDLQFVSAILSPSGWGEDWPSLYSTYNQLIGILKDAIDPFDYDVFAPHMGRMLERQLQRSNVMLGVLINIRGHQTTVRFPPSQPSSTGHSEKHIVLPLSSGGLPRLSLLPSHASGSSNGGVILHRAGASLLHQWLEHKTRDHHVPSFVNLTATLQHFH